MRIFAILLLAATSTMVNAQPILKPTLIVSNEPFSPDGKVEQHEMLNELNKIEKGTLNGVPYSFYYTDGSGTFAGRVGNVGNYSDPSGSNWDVACRKDPVNDKKYCRMTTDDLWIYVYPKGKATVSIGHDHFPGSAVTIRIDGGTPVTQPASKDGGFSQPSSERIVRQLKTAKTVTTRYMEWPYRSWVDRTWDLYGFNEAFQYLTWAVQRIK